MFNKISNKTTNQPPETHTPLHHHHQQQLPQYPLLPLGALNPADIKSIFDHISQHLGKVTIALNHNQQQIVQQIDHIHQLLLLFSNDIRYQTTLFQLFNVSNYHPRVEARLAQLQRDQRMPQRERDEGRYYYREMYNYNLQQIQQYKQQQADHYQRHVQATPTPPGGAHRNQYIDLQYDEEYNHQLQQHQEQQHNSQPRSHIFPIYQPLLTHTILIQLDDVMEQQNQRRHHLIFQQQQQQQLQLQRQSSNYNINTTTNTAITTNINTNTTTTTTTTTSTVLTTTNSHDDIYSTHDTFSTTQSHPQSFTTTHTKTRPTVINICLDHGIFLPSYEVFQQRKKANLAILNYTDLYSFNALYLKKLLSTPYQPPVVYQPQLHMFQANQSHQQQQDGFSTPMKKIVHADNTTTLTPLHPATPSGHGDENYVNHFKSIQTPSKEAQKEKEKNMLNINQMITATNTLLQEIDQLGINIISLHHLLFGMTQD